MEKILLSICIPTYNRAEILKELINQILEVKSDEFEIVITNNVSNDDTRKVLASFTDRRLRVIDNQKKIPALNNMIEAIYNAKGKYALYCNDRDLLTVNGIISLIELLHTDEFAFVYTTPCRANNTNKVTIFKSAFESLIGHRCGYHPSGMVFNMDIAHKALKKDIYFEYLRDQNTYCFLMRDLFSFGKTAIIDNGCWKERPREFLAKNISGTVVDENLFFYPKLKYILAVDTLEQIRKNEKLELTNKEKENVYKYILNHYGQSLITYKSNMMSKYMTRHYNIERKFISTFKMYKILRKYQCECDDYLRQSGYLSEIPWVMQTLWKGSGTQIVKASIKSDLIFLTHFLRREDF